MKKVLSALIIFVFVCSLISKAQDRNWNEAVAATEDSIASDTTAADTPLTW